jgi:ketol-acid reductoisomerase
MEPTIFQESDADFSTLKNKKIAIIGYGNQAKALSLNMRDSGFKIVVGVQEKDYRNRADNDQFKTVSISDAVKEAQFIFVLLSDEVMLNIFKKKILAHLTPNKTLIFDDGYYLAFNILEIPNDIDVLLISPRALGEVVRKQYINQEGFFTFIGLYQDSSGKGMTNLLALTKAIGGLKRAALIMSCRQQANLALFAEQAFRSAFKQILMISIKNLVDAGYPPEAIYIELILSEEMIYTIEKMIKVGLIKQMNFHSQTSQYGSLSRGVKFSKVSGDIKKVHKKVLQKIENGKFSKEWEHNKETLKLPIMKYFAFNTNFGQLEKETYKNLNYSIDEWQKEPESPPKEQLKKNDALNTVYETYKKFYKQF